MIVGKPITLTPISFAIDSNDEEAIEIPLPTMDPRTIFYGNQEIVNRLKEYQQSNPLATIHSATFVCMHGYCVRVFFIKD